MRESTRELMFSSLSAEWETPWDLFDNLNREFRFTLDPAATAENALCEKYYTARENGLEQDWSGEAVFLNPPYGREVGKWVEKAYEEANKQKRERAIVVLLLPARTDTRWFHDYVLRANEIRFIRGRLKFNNRLIPGWREDGSHLVSPAPFPSMIVEYHHRWSLPRHHGGPVISSANRIGDRI